MSEITEEMRRIAIEEGFDPDQVKCWFCMDGAHYPQYGRAPHKSIAVSWAKGQLPQSEWPADFKPDWDGIPEAEQAAYDGPLCGTWYCPKDCEKGGISHAP